MVPHQILHATRIPPSSTHIRTLSYSRRFFFISLTQHSRFSDQRRSRCRRRHRRRRRRRRRHFASSRSIDVALSLRQLPLLLCVACMCWTVSSCLGRLGARARFAIPTNQSVYVLFPFQQKFLYLIKRSRFFFSVRKCSIADKCVHVWYDVTQ